MGDSEELETLQPTRSFVNSEEKARQLVKGKKCLSFELKFSVSRCVWSFFCVFQARYLARFPTLPSGRARTAVFIWAGTWAASHALRGKARRWREVARGGATTETRKGTSLKRKPAPYLRNIGTLEQTATLSRFRRPWLISPDIYSRSDPKKRKTNGEAKLICGPGTWVLLCVLGT